MKKLKILAAALSMLLCIGAVSYEVSAEPVMEGIVANKVEGVKAGACTAKSINIHWKQTAGVSGYEIYRSTARNGKYTLLKVLPAGCQAFMNTTVTAGKEYFYKIRSFINTGQGKAYSKFSKILRTNTIPLSVRKARARLNINVRKYAGTNYARLFGLAKGKKVSILCETCDKSGAKWYRIQVKINGKKYIGYVRGDLLV